MIDSSVLKSRQGEMAGEVRAVVGPLVSFDMRQEASAALQAATMPGVAGALPFDIHSAQVMAIAPGKAESDGQIAATRGGPALLMLLVQYALEPGLGAFTTRTSAVLRQDGNTEPTYRAAIIYQAPLQPGTREQVMARLTADDGKLLRAYMQESVRETLGAVALDLSAPAAAGQAPAGKLPTHRFNLRGNIIDLPAATVATTASSRLVVRNEAGALFSLQKESQ